MADFKVIKTQIKIFPHPNAEKLELLKIGAYQAVVQKDLYRDGDVVAAKVSIYATKLEKLLLVLKAYSNKVK